MKSNKKNLVKVGLCSLVLSMGVNAQASGIPTLDGAVLGQGIQSFIEYLTQYGEQLDTWDIESEQFNKHFASVTTGLNIVDEIFDGNIGDSLKEMGFQKAYEKLFGGEGNDYISALASKGIDGLTQGTMSKIKEMYPQDGDKSTAQGRAKNLSQEMCGLYDGVRLDLAVLDKAKLEANKAAAAEMKKTAGKIKGEKTEDGKESASMVGSVQAALDLQGKEYAKGEQEYVAKRAEMVKQMNDYRAKCDSAKVDLGRLAATAIGVGAKLYSLKFGSDSSKSTKSFDPRFK